MESLSLLDTPTTTLSSQAHSFQCKYHGLYNIKYWFIFGTRPSESLPNPSTRPAVCTEKNMCVTFTFQNNVLSYRKTIGGEVCLSHVIHQ